MGGCICCDCDQSQFNHNQQFQRQKVKPSSSMKCNQTLNGKIYPQNQLNLPQFQVQRQPGHTHFGPISIVVNSDTPFSKSQIKIVINCGLKNIGNTCYLNSALQCLIHSNQLMQSLQRLQKNNDREFVQQLGKLSSAAKSWSTPFVPFEIKKLIQNSNSLFKGNKQQDSCEVLSTILSLVCVETNYVKTQQQRTTINYSYEQSDEQLYNRYVQRDKAISNSIIDSVFTGRFKTTYKCLTCNKEKRLFQKFNIVHLPVSSKLKLEDCLDEFNKPDNIPDWKCQNCNKQVPHQKQMIIYEANNVLIFCLKRFKESSTKINDPIDIPLNIKINLLKNGSQKTNNQQVYDLYGAINHYGSLRCGHYKAYCSKGAEGWFQYDDETVSIIKKQQILQLLKKAYILFYRKKTFSKIQIDNK